MTIASVSSGRPIKQFFFHSDQAISCNWVCNEVSLKLWCHAVVHFEVKMSCFEPVFRMIVWKILEDPHTVSFRRLQ